MIIALSDGAWLTIFLIAAMPVALFVGWIVRNAIKELLYGPGWYEREQERKRTRRMPQPQHHAEIERAGVAAAAMHSEPPTAQVRPESQVAGASEPVRASTSVEHRNDGVVITMSGHGNDYSELFHLNAGLTFAESSRSGGLIFSVDLLDARREKVEMLAYTVEAETERKAFRVDAEGEYLVNVDCDGSWTVTMRQPVAQPETRDEI